MKKLTSLGLLFYYAICHSQTVKTSGSLTIDSQSINYEAETGFFPLVDDEGKKLANIFFTYYSTKQEDNRSITFAFNGGPGSPSCWLHMGAMGPYRIDLGALGLSTSPPYRYTNNNSSWLDLTDLVFIDPVYTGFSRPSEGVDKSIFMGFEKDASYIADFIYQFISEKKRWKSPLYIAGESYGAIRAVGVANALQSKYSIYLNGLMLISGLMDYQTLDEAAGNELPYVLRLPTLAATAHYHKRLSPDKELAPLLEEVEQFTEDEYNSALLKGLSLLKNERTSITSTLKALTGLPEEYISETNLRFKVGEVNMHLLPDNQVFGRLDTRMTGYDLIHSGNQYSFDPSFESLIKAPYLSVIHQYIREKLNFDVGNSTYDIISGRTYPWDFNSQNHFLNTTSTLALIMSKNPGMMVWVSGGLYDLATPYYAAQYSLNHLWVSKPIRDNIKTTWYKGGHMFYHDLEILKEFKEDAEKFYQMMVESKKN